MIPIRTSLTWREFMETVSVIQPLTLNPAEFAMHDAERLEHLARMVRVGLMEVSKRKFEEERKSAL